MAEDRIEDLSFKFLMPELYDELVERWQRKRNRKDTSGSETVEAKLKGRIHGRFQAELNTTTGSSEDAKTGHHL